MYDCMFVGAITILVLKLLRNRIICAKRIFEVVRICVIAQQMNRVWTMMIDLHDDMITNSYTVLRIPSYCTDKSTADYRQCALVVR